MNPRQVSLETPRRKVITAKAETEFPTGGLEVK
jgi:hypothetical protein